MRITAENPIKQKLLDDARKYYLDAMGNRESKASLTKVTLKDDAIMDLSSANPKPLVKLHTGFYDYVHVDAPMEKTAWVSFANKYLGGGFRGKGYVQEEILTLEFYEMSELIVENWRPIMQPRDAYIFKNLVRTSVSSSYGNYMKGALTYPDTIVTANFLAIDAPDRRGLSSVYTKQQIDYIITKAYSGFIGCKALGMDVIQTGNWGAGVFNNKHDVVYYVQLLCAWCAGIRVIGLWGYEASKGKKVLDAYNRARTIDEFLDAAPSVLGLNIEILPK